jgi:predicted lipid-binding transport protein (Tim44 family)
MLKFDLARLRERLARHLARRLAGLLARLIAQHPMGWPGRQRHGSNEVEELLRVARLSFLALQSAWDRADLGAMSALATEPLLDDLRLQLAERGPGPNHTEVLSLDARLLDLEELREAFVASVEFSGLIRERLDAGACPFRELWLLAKVKATGRGWQLARVQSLS